MSQPEAYAHLTRKLHLTDWSGKSERNQHLSFLLAYRMIVFDDTTEEAVNAVAATTGATPTTLRKLRKTGIIITFSDPAIEDVPDVWASAYRKVTAT